MPFPFAALLPVLSQVIDSVLPDPEAREKAKLALIQQQQDGKFREAEIQLSAIIAEARSTDPWTSRARPSFLYVVYAYILAAIPMGGLFAFDPTAASDITQGVQDWLAAIPTHMWWLFGAGYLGYTSARTLDKRGIKWSK